MEFVIDIGRFLTFIYWLLCFILAGFLIMFCFWFYAVYAYWQEWRANRDRRDHRNKWDNIV